jgi:hypothetical protein
VVLFAVGGCGQTDSSTKTEAESPSLRPPIESHNNADPGKMTIRFAEEFLKLEVQGEPRQFTGLWIDFFQATVSTSGPNARNGRGSVNHKSWCAGFLQWLIFATEGSTGRVSPVYPSKLVMEMWDKSKSLQVKAGSLEAKSPKAGWIAVWERTRVDNLPVEEALRGHAELVVSRKSQNPFVIDTIGANTSPDPEGTNPAEGNGIFRHETNNPLRFGRANTSWKYKFLGFLKTWGN